MVTKFITQLRREHGIPPLVVYLGILVAGLFALVLIVITILVLYANVHSAYLADNVVKRSDLQLASSAHALDRLQWYSHRPGLYFGLRTRHEKSPLFGVMWYKQPLPLTVNDELPPPPSSSLQPTWKQRLRHWCKLEQNVSFIWDAADGRSFGRQNIKDGDGLNFDTAWLNNNRREWSARFDINLPNRGGVERKEEDNEDPPGYAFIFYFAVQDTNDTQLVPTYQFHPSTASNGNGSAEIEYAVFRGHSPTLGEFALNMRVHVQAKSNRGAGAPATGAVPSANGSANDRGSPLASIISHASFGAGSEPLDVGRIGDRIVGALRALRRKQPTPAASRDDGPQQHHQKQQMLYLEEGAWGEGKIELIAVQLYVEENTTIQLDYTVVDDRAELVAGRTVLSDMFDSILEERVKAFHSRYDQLFPIGEELAKQVGVPHTLLLEMGRRALANMLGSIGFWHGHVLVASEGKFDEGEVRNYGPLNLLSAVPSRTSYSRGFLWDEGFHCILIAKFDPALALDILSSWLDTLNADGWIPREMALEAEERSRMPISALIQYDHLTYPPTFFHLINKLLDDQPTTQRYILRLKALYPRLRKYYDWIRTTQAGPRQGTFQWRGRSSSPNDDQLNPTTLASGLGDYPRASHLSPTSEYNLDLRCWMAVASRAIRRLAELADVDDDDETAYSQLSSQEALYNSVETLDALHWSNRTQNYHDFGLHSTHIRLAEVVGENGGKRYERRVLEAPHERLVDDVNGYVSLFPLLLGLLPIDSGKLTIMLRRLNDSNELWTPYGLRSLSTRSTIYYAVRNSQNEFPLYRGPIWININYLALEALYRYSRNVPASTGRDPGNDINDYDIDGERPWPAQRQPKTSAVAMLNAQLSGELYSQLRVNVVRAVAEQFRSSETVWEYYNDMTGAGGGTHPSTGWTALVVRVMSGVYD